jgi:hypothetical protein
VRLRGACIAANRAHLHKRGGSKVCATMLLASFPPTQFYRVTGQYNV